MQENIASIRSLSISFSTNEGILNAVRDLDLDLPKAQITCLVGESGCGKSLTCRAILRLIPENAILSGQIIFNNQNLLALSNAALRTIRGASISMIFQEPMTSLNPVLTVGEQTAEPLRLHRGLSKSEAKERAIELFSQVGIPAPRNRYSDYPHQLSGGMRQRVMIAMALSCQPVLLLADEPTTALDSTIQGQILRLIYQESKERGMATLLITHDLGVAAEMSKFVGVMYAGVLVEYANTDILFSEPLHPYTQGLITAAPSRFSYLSNRLPSIPGAVPALSEMPEGCPFHPRCDRVKPICSKKIPPLVNITGHMVKCWLYAQ